MPGEWTAYQVVIVCILAVLFGAWSVGAVVGSHKIERNAIRGLLLAVALAALAWLVLDTPPVPQSILAIVRGLFG